MIPCFTHEGMVNLIGWHVGEVIFAKIAAETAAAEAEQAAPGYTPEPFVWGVKTKKKAPKTLAEYCEDIRARQRATK